MNTPDDLPFPVWANFEFTGAAREYFNIWIVNILLTIVTLGIYSAWAKVRRERYFYGNTRLKGSSFHYTADPIVILKSRILAVLIFAIFWILFNAYPALSLWTIGAACLFFPFVVVTSTSFRLRNSMYRNIRFRFDRDFGGAYRVFIIPIAVIVGSTAMLYGLFEGSEMLAEMEKAEDSDFEKEDMLFSLFLLSFLPLVPYLVYALRRFTVDRMHFGNAGGSFHSGPWAFYKPYLLMAVLTLALAFVIGIAVGVLFSAFGPEAPTDGNAEDYVRSLALFVILFSIVFYGIGFYLLGFLNARIANVTYNHTEIGPLVLHSTLRGRDLGNLYLTNTLAIIASLGLLIPWSQVRMARYKAARLELLARDLAGIEAINAPEPGALGEELGDAFDVDLGI